MAGSGAVRLLADQVGLTGQLSTALARRRFLPVHTRGQVLVDLATVLAAGGEAIADIDTLRHDPVWGPVASPATVWRTLEAVTPAALGRIAKARAKVRRHVWGQFPGGLPAAPVAGSDLDDTVVIDVDATLVTAHSDKEQAAANFKGGYGFHPLGAWCDNTGEMLAVRLRPGNSNANHAGDHIAVLGEAIRQIPPPYRRRLLVRADTAGATHQLLGLAERTGPGSGPFGGVLDRVPCPQRDRGPRCDPHRAGHGVAGCARRRRRTPRERWGGRDHRPPRPRPRGRRGCGSSSAGRSRTPEPD